MNVNEKKTAFKEIALERRSIRKYDETVNISHEEMVEILEMAVSAPSSSNMQPWRFVVVNRSQVKEKLLPYVQFNSGPVSTASAVIAIFGDLESVKKAGDIMQKTAEMRGQSVKDIFPIASDEDNEPSRPSIPIGVQGKDPREMIIGMLNSLTREQKKNIALIDCGLVVMQLMQVARVFGYDTCALGGYDKETVGKVLEMDSERYEPIMLLTIGKAVEHGNPPYRLPVSSVTKFYE